MPTSPRVSVDDIRAKARLVEDTVKQTQETAKDGATWLIGGAIVVLILVFLFGRRRGKSGGAIVEVYKV